MPEREPRWRDADRMDLRIDQGRLRRRHVRTLAREIARIHGEAPKAPEDSAAASPGGIGRQLHGDLEALSEQGILPSRMSDALQERKYEVLTDGLNAILDRREEGKVRRLHGTLLPERIWLRGRRVRIATPAEDTWGDVCELLTLIYR